jgi:hypothetical protein
MATLVSNATAMRNTPYAISHGPSRMCSARRPVAANAACAMNSASHNTNTAAWMWMISGALTVPASSLPKYVGQNPTNAISVMSNASGTKMRCFGRCAGAVFKSLLVRVPTASRTDLRRQLTGNVRAGRPSRRIRPAVRARAAAR